VRCALVFASREGKYLILGESSLCFGPQNIPPEELVAKKDFGRALPPSVNPGPKDSVPWNYVITLANGHVLRARPGNEARNDRSLCHSRKSKSWSPWATYGKRDRIPEHFPTRKTSGTLCCAKNSKEQTVRSRARNWTEYLPMSFVWLAAA
jgi:hypothetical protein